MKPGGTVSGTASRTAEKALKKAPEALNKCTSAILPPYKFYL